MRPPLPSLRPAASAKLFVFGATIGPIVDSFHNQCLLQYELAPITIPWPEAFVGLKETLEQEYLLCSSWSVPLLLGFAYVVLGDLLPRLFESLLSSLTNQGGRLPTQNPIQRSANLQTKAILAVLSTALIIKLSQYLELHQPLTAAVASSPFTSAEVNSIFLLCTALLQWRLLDGTLPALLAASITSIGGPLSELPFVANGFWEYIERAGDYYPLTNIPETWGFLTPLLGDNYQDLALSSITGACYFAVTLDAIALGRLFQFQAARDDETTDNS